MRPGSDRKVHWAPTDKRNSCSVWCSSVEIVTICVYATANLDWSGRQLEMLLMLLGAVVPASQREDHRIADPAAR